MLCLPYFVFPICHAYLTKVLFRYRGNSSKALVRSCTDRTAVSPEAVVNEKKVKEHGDVSLGWKIQGNGVTQEIHTVSGLITKQMIGLQ